MTSVAAAADPLEIFLVAIPGLEPALHAQVRACGFPEATLIKGGVVIRGGWPAVWRANLEVRGASRILARIAEFRAMHLAQLDKRARKVPWRDLLRADVPFKVEATCTASRIYHSGAAAQRIERAIRETLGVQGPGPSEGPAPAGAPALVVVKARIDDDLCTIAIDTSGEPLHRRGHKEAVAKAPLRETMASLLLQMCEYTGAEPVLDPMCGSGTFVIEAAEIAAGLAPGRTRAFAFEHLATFDPIAWQDLRRAAAAPRPLPGVRFFGSDQDPGAIRMSRENAARAGVSALTQFEACKVEDLLAPEGPAGLVAVNPPYGDRIGEARDLVPLYRALGQTLATRFAGWRVGLITTDETLARATSLPFAAPSPPILHGGLRVRLFQTGRLG